jgi:hypothetical protein
MITRIMAVFPISASALELELASIKNKDDSPFPKLKQLTESLSEAERTYLLGLLSREVLLACLCLAFELFASNQIILAITIV